MTFGIGTGLFKSNTPGTGGGAPTLQLSSTSVAEDASLSTVVGALSVANLPDGVTVSGYSITADPDSKFDISSSNLITDATLDYETSTSHSVTIRATLSEGDPVDRTFAISVTNVLEVTLSDLSLDNASFTEGDAAATVIGAITGATSGSTVTLQDDAGGKAAKSGNNIVVGATAASVGTFNITLRETHPDGSNSPKDTVIEITVASAVITQAQIIALSPYSFWSIRDLSDVWVERTSPTTNVAADGDLVGYIDDLSGNNQDMSALDDAKRPAYKSISGTSSLLFDGTDDFLTANISSPPANCSIFTRAKFTDTKGITFQGQITGKYLLVYEDGSTSTTMSLATGDPDVYIDGVLFEHGVATRQDLYDALVDGSYHTIEIRGADLSGWTSITYGWVTGDLNTVQGNAFRDTIIIPTANFDSDDRDNIIIPYIEQEG